MNFLDVYSENLYRSIITTFFAVTIGVAAYYRRRAAKTGDQISYKEEGVIVMLLLRITGVCMWLSALTYCIYPTALAWAQMPDFPVWLRIFGLILSVSAIGFIVWTFRSIGQNITTTVVIKREHKLITHGIYRYVRHPLYTFGTLFFFSIGLGAANWLLLLLPLIALAMLLVRLPNEEAHLIEAFGDEYREYMRRTGALIPRLRR